MIDPVIMVTTNELCLPFMVRFMVRFWVRVRLRVIGLG
jgi:hypothetical protein